MGVAIREDGGTLGVFSPKKVGLLEKRENRGYIQTLFRQNYVLYESGVEIYVNHGPVFHVFLLSVVASPFSCYRHTCLRVLCVYSSHTQLSHDGPFDEQFDCLSAKKVSLFGNQRKKLE